MNLKWNTGRPAGPRFDYCHRDWGAAYTAPDLIMTTQEKISIIAIGALVIGWPISAYIGYLFGLRSQRIAREFAAADAVKNRIRDLYANICTLKSSASHNNPSQWVGPFQQAMPQLQATFQTIASDFNTVDRESIRKLIEELVAQARLSPAEIYNQEDRIKRNIGGLERLVNAAFNPE